SFVLCCLALLTIGYIIYAQFSGEYRLDSIFKLPCLLFVALGATASTGFPGKYKWDKILKRYDYTCESWNDYFNQNNDIYNYIKENVEGDGNIKGKWEDYYQSLSPDDRREEIGKLEEVQGKITKIKQIIKDDYLKTTSNFQDDMDMIQSQIDAAYEKFTKEYPIPLNLKSGKADLYFKTLRGSDQEKTSILLLSGGPGFSSKYLLPVAQKLSDRYRCILLDQRGTGKSKLPSNTTPDNIPPEIRKDFESKMATFQNARQVKIDRTNRQVYLQKSGEENITENDFSSVSSDSLIGDIEIVKKELGIEKWIIFGHSWGGRLAMAYTAKHPSEVEALVLAASAGVDSDVYDKIFRKNIEAYLTVPVIEASDYWNMIRMRNNKLSEAIIEGLRSQLSAFFFDDSDALPLIPILKDEFTPELYQMITIDKSASGQTVDKELDNIINNKDNGIFTFKNPVLIIQGQQDPVGLSTAYDIRDSLKGVSKKELVLIPECGHFIWFEKPKEFFEKVSNFLNGL
ncbi:MAG: proline iminopeptidase, partial [Candidatus Poribacteria bacterium]|nr:proline iminopeptidase [Candidatus Poribacteria bacterium]